MASGGDFGKNSTRQRVSALAMSNLQALSSLLAAAFLTIPAASSAAASSPTTSAHPNIVVIYADDLVMETDAVVGRVLAALDESGAAENTLVVFTSDNGCAPYIGVPEMEKQGHFPSGPLRG